MLLLVGEYFLLVFRSRKANKRSKKLLLLVRTHGLRSREAKNCEVSRSRIVSKNKKSENRNFPDTVLQTFDGKCPAVVDGW